MILFMIKKTFFDLLDHLFFVFLSNVGFIVLLALFLFLSNLLKPFPLLSLLAAAIGILVLIIYTGGIFRYVQEFSDYKTPDIQDFFICFGKMLKPSLVFFLIVSGYTILSTISMSYYLRLKGMGLIPAGILFWVSIIFVLSIQYFFVVYSRLGEKIMKTIKKCLILFLDNISFSIILFLGSVFIMVFSVLLGFLLPGITGVALWLNVGLKLRLYKYDYLEANPEANRKKIPWKELLTEDIECVGKRTLKDFIFPWKN